MPDGEIVVTPRWNWIDLTGFPGAFDFIAPVLAAVMLVVFVRSLRTRCGKWGPLVIGLFILGTGLFCGNLRVMKSMLIMADTVALACPQDIFVGLYGGLWCVAWGTGFALLGGFLTVILHCRNERFRAEQAEAGTQEAVEG